MSRALGWWRHAALAGAVIGLLAAAVMPAPRGWLPCLLAASLALAIMGRRLLHDSQLQVGSSGARVAWLACLAGLGALAGMGIGTERLEGIDGGALIGPEAVQVELEGFVAGTPRRSFGEVRVPVETAEGRLLVIAREPVADLQVGAAIRARGLLVRPDGAFDEAELERLGAVVMLDAERLEPRSGGRAGFVGALDRARSRAETALDDGMNDQQAALARGFVLGQDDLIDPATREDFQRAGLSHLLAVSGQNVMLLAILGGVVFAAFGAGLRMRLVLTLLLIAAYVPIAGAGASIQRAGVMGAAGIVATLAGRPADRLYAVLLAAGVTLVINPRFGADAGWQLSFAALLGIMLWAGPIRKLIAGSLVKRIPRRLAGPIAEGAALTIAATVATAPLIAHDFEQFSVAALPANIAVLPLIAPVMWIGMAIGLLAQLPSVQVGPLDPVAMLGSIEGRLVDLVAAVAALFAEPTWAQLETPLPELASVIAVYAALGVLLTLAIQLVRRRRTLAPARTISLGLATVALLALVPFLLRPGNRVVPPTPGALRITELDVGQGDSILLQPPRGAPILVDGGPPGGAAADALRDLGIDHLRAIFATHDDLDHSGGLPEVIESVDADLLVRAKPDPALEAAARAAGTRVLTTAGGAAFDFGRLRLEVLWPPGESLDDSTDRGNLDAIVLLARFAGYDSLLAADAEQELTHLDPGPFDVLKVAHHGSDDAGLVDLLERSVPRVALISVGSDNTYGHPTADTLETLAGHGVCTLRTDLDGAASVEMGPAGLSAWTAEGAPPADRPGCASEQG